MHMLYLRLNIVILLIAFVLFQSLESLKKQIIQTASNKKHLTYLETKYLFQLEVLENPDLYYNDNILGKFFTSDFAS